MTPKSLVGIFIGLAFLLFFIIAIHSSSLHLPMIPPGSVDVGAVKWGSRSFEVLLQGFILLAGVMAIILLLGSRKDRDVPP